MNAICSSSRERVKCCGSGGQQPGDEHDEERELGDHGHRQRERVRPDRGDPRPPVEEGPQHRHPRPLVEPERRKQHRHRDHRRRIPRACPAHDLRDRQQQEDQPVVVAEEDRIRPDIDAGAGPEEVEIPLLAAIERCPPDARPEPAAQQPAQPDPDQRQQDVPRAVGAEVVDDPDRQCAEPLRRRRTP